jgi:hypothetical protein
VQGGDHLIEPVGDGLHLGLGGRVRDRQAELHHPGGHVEAVLDGLELAAQFRREDRRVIRRTWSFCILHSAFCIPLTRPPEGQRKSEVAPASRFGGFLFPVDPFRPWS